MVSIAIVATVKKQSWLSNDFVSIATVPETTVVPVSVTFAIEFSIQEGSQSIEIAV